MGVRMTQDSSWRQQVGFGDKLQNIVPQIKKVGPCVTSYPPWRR